MPVADPFLSKHLKHVPALLNSITAAAAADGCHRPTARNKRLVAQMTSGYQSATLARNWNRWLLMENVPDLAGLAQVVRAAKRCGWLPDDLSAGARKIADHALRVTLVERTERLHDATRELRELTTKLFERKDLQADDALQLLPSLLHNLTQVLVAEGQTACRVGDSAIVRRVADSAARLVREELDDLAEELEAAEADDELAMPALSLEFEEVEAHDLPTGQERAQALAEFEAQQEAIARALNPKGMHVRLGRHLKRVR